MKKHIISLTGDLAAGKTTITKLLIEELGYSIYKNGERFRNMAKEMNMSVS
jgi:cytidylate kinase